MKPEGGLWVANLEIASDHAMIPFGAGERKCVGDQFALLEAAVSVVMLLRRFEFDLKMDPVGLIPSWDPTPYGTPPQLSGLSLYGPQGREPWSFAAAPLTGHRSSRSVVRPRGVNLSLSSNRSACRTLRATLPCGNVRAN